MDARKVVLVAGLVALAVSAARHELAGAARAVGDGVRRFLAGLTPVDGTEAPAVEGGFFVKGAKSGVTIHRDGSAVDAPAWEV